MQGRSLSVQSQARAYIGVIGVVVGMLIAGLLVPFAFGRVPQATDNAVATGDLSLDGLSSGDLGAGDVPGVAGPGGGKGGKLDGSGGGSVSLGPGASQGPGGAGAGKGSSPTSGPSSSQGPVTSGPLTASDTGVTASTIKLGVVLLDIEALKPLGFGQPHFSPAEQREQYQVFIDDVNAAGGILGRKIVPAYRTYNALDSNGNTSTGAVCRQLAEDDKVFASLSNNTEISRCLNKTYGIPVVQAGGSLNEDYSKGLLMTAFAKLERYALNWGDLAVRTGLTKGRTLGTLRTNVPEAESSEAYLTKAMQDAGGTIAYRGQLAGEASQVPVEVQKMKAAKVDTVFLVTDFVTAINFVTSAEQQNYRPLYVVSDFGSMSAEGLLTSMPRSFDGAVLYTQAPYRPGPESTACVDRFNEKTGNDYAYDTESGGVRQFCWLVSGFAAASEQAGTDLTHESFSAGIQRVTKPLGLLLAGRFGSGKFDYSDTYRTGIFDYDCTCYIQPGKAIAGRY